MYRMNFILFDNYKWSLSDVENMISWERDVYVSLLQAKLQREQK